MNRSAARPLLASILAVVLLLCTPACAVPLAPGYRILQESRDVRFVPGPPAELQIRGSYKLQNTGNSDLAFVDVVVPDEHLYGRKNLHAEVNGRETALQNLGEEIPREGANKLRMTFDPPWKRKEVREVVFAYSLISPEDSGRRITLGEEDFHLGSLGWSPLLQPPKHLLAPYPKRPPRTSYTVRVPENFLVLARGKAAGKKQEGGEIEYRFELHAEDLAPYIVAGRYVESSAGRDSMVFWTHEPLKEGVGPAETQITSAWRVLQAAFGTFDTRIREPHIVESPELRGFTGEGRPAATSFPGGALINPALLAQGIGNEDSLQRITHALAHNWFGDAVYPDPEAALGLGEGLPEFATIFVEEATNGELARRARIRHYLQIYDQASQQAAEQPLGITSLTDPPGVRRIAMAKAPLFFAALEDACGPAQLAQGLSKWVTLLRGQEVSYDSLRAVLEQTSGRQLAELFRAWLNDKGIPQDFRNRYEPPLNQETGD